LGASRTVLAFDIGGADCWLAAERAVAVLDEVPVFLPVEAAGLPDGLPDADLEAVAAGARRAGLLPLRAPRTAPRDTRRAMLAATYARQAGRVVAFSHAALRQVWAGGRDLDQDTLRIAGAAAEIHPVALDRGISLASTARALDEATAEALAAGATTVPAILAGDRAWCGPSALDDAAAALAAAR